MNNLNNFPTINCVTLEQSSHRHQIILQQVEKYNLNIKFCYAYDGVNNSLSDLADVSGSFLNEMNQGEICAVISHLKSISEWYTNTDEEYGFFCEDDVLLELNEKWNFTWDDFINHLPSNWGAVQLSLIRNFQSETFDISDRFMKFHSYVWDNWSACSYIVSRRYAKQLIDFHCKGENIFDLNLPYYPNTVPFIENVLFNADNKETVYTLPLFVENTEIASSFYPKFIESNLKDNQKYSSHLVCEWWKKYGKSKSVEWFFSKDSEDQEETNFLLVNPGYVKTRGTCWIVDNFYENPDQIREFALKQDYLEGGLGRGFIGRRTHQQFLFPGLKERFEEIMSKKVTGWEGYDMNGRFQVAWAGEPLVWHCDNQQWGGMLYLTPNAPYQCGTTLYAHKQTRARTFHDEGWDAAWRDIPGDPHLDGTPWEPVDVLGNVYNRLVIFDASAIHSASEYFGTVMENARLWQMFFFDAEPA